MNDGGSHYVSRVLDLYDLLQERTLRRQKTIDSNGNHFGEYFEHIIFLELRAWIDSRHGIGVCRDERRRLTHRLRRFPDTPPQPSPLNLASRNTSHDVMQQENER